MITFVVEVRNGTGERVFLSVQSHTISGAEVDALIAMRRRWPSHGIRVFRETARVVESYASPHRGPLVLTGDAEEPGQSPLP